MNLMTIIGCNIKDYRQKMGYTQENLAAFLGIDRSTISHYENAEREASLVHLSKLADLFGIEIEDLTEPNAVAKTTNLAFAFRRDGFDEQDLSSIASFQKIIKNYLRMTEIQKNDK